MRSLVEFTLALQGKWLRGFMREQDDLQRKVVAAKFGVDNSG